MNAAASPGDASSTSTSTNPTRTGGRGFGDAIRQRQQQQQQEAEAAASSAGKGDGKRSRRRGPPNSFSAIGQAVRHRGKFGGGPMEFGLLDMSSKLMERHESIKERYAGHKPVQAGAGRQRGAKKAAAFHALSSYSLHFLK